MPTIQTCDCPNQISSYSSDDHLERAKEELEAYNDLDALRAIANALIAVCERLDKILPQPPYRPTPPPTLQEESNNAKHPLVKWSDDFYERWLEYGKRNLVSISTWNAIVRASRIRTQFLDEYDDNCLLSFKDNRGNFMSFDEWRYTILNYPRFKNKILAIRNIGEKRYIELLHAFYKDGRG